MEINLGLVLLVRIILVNKGNTLAKVAWVFENGELKWGRISESQYENEHEWVQLPKFLAKNWVTPLKITDPFIEKTLFEFAIDAYKEALEGSSKEEGSIHEMKIEYN